MKTANATTKNTFTVNFFAKKIEGTKAAFERASKPGTAEYKELIALMESHPNFELHVIKPKKHITGYKKTYEGMNDAFMKDYISIQENAKSLMEEYEEGKRLAKEDGRSVYPTMKKWFLDQFSSEEKPFDMKEAKAAIAKSKNESFKQKVKLSLKSKTTDNTVAFNKAFNQ